MSEYSQEELQKLESAASIILDAEEQLPVLNTLAWDRSVAENFFNNNEKILPRPHYNKIEIHGISEQIHQAKKLIAGTSPVHEWLKRYACTVEKTAHLLANVGTKEFHKISCELFGTAGTPIADGRLTAIHLAQRINQLLTEFDEGSIRLEPPESLSSFDLKRLLDDQLKVYFGDQSPEVLVTFDMSSKAAAGKNYIKLRQDATFSDLDVTQLLQHEALIHIATGKNGRNQQHFKILGESYPGNTRTQEGLAVFAEFISGALDPHRFKRLANRVIAIDMAEQGADFIELYQFFLENGITDNPYDAFESAFRIVRGGLVEGGAPFTKDSVYLGGLIDVHSYLRTVIRSGDAKNIRLLFVGKIDLRDISAIKVLLHEKLISEPKFMPHWVKDLRFLLSYLTYSTFLNEINLVEVEKRFNKIFEIIPPA